MGKARSRKLIINPTLRFKLSAGWNRRAVGAQMATYRLTWSTAELIEFLVAEWLGRPITPSLELAQHLLELGILTWDDEAPGPIGFDFRWPLNGDLVPSPNELNYDRRIALEALVVNPSCEVQLGERLPAVLEGRVDGASFERGRDAVLWIVDPGTGVAAPYRVPRRLGQKLKRMRGGLSRDRLHELIRSEGMHKGQVELLRRAHVLVPKDWEKTRRRQWAASIKRLRQQLARDEYVVVRGLLNPVQVALLRAYYRAASLAGAFLRGDTQMEERSVEHNEKVARFLHHQLAPLVGRIVPEAIRPSYCYLGIYEPGAVLPRHVDREQCAWNLSVPLDAEPETDARSAWPIHFEVRRKVHSVRLGLGDGVLYRGSELPHWRDAQPSGHRTTVAFFHFVDATFDGSLD